MNMKVKKQMISLLVLAMFSGMCWAQGPASAPQAEAANKGQMFQLKDVKMARSGEQWFKVTTDINCHSQYAPLHKMMTRVLFGKEKECSSLDSALQRHMAEYDEVVSPTGFDRPVAQFEDIKVTFRGGDEKRFLNYHVSYMQLTMQDKESVQKNRERSMVYDVVHGKMLTLSDVFIPSVATRMKNLAPHIGQFPAIELTVENERVKEQVENIRSKILSTLKLHLHNSAITLNVTVIQREEPLRPLSRREQFEVLEKENPSVRKLREVFDLDLA